MTVSLIIPVYNRLHLLEKCLLCVYKQSLAPDEIILSDDGSEEDIVQFFQQQKQLTPIPIKLVRHQHTRFRASRVRNNGVAVSKGELLVFIDQDIIIPPQYIYDAVNSIGSNRFLSAYPIRLSEAQSASVDKAAIDHAGYYKLVNPAQKAKIRRQFRKDLLSYRLCRYLGIGKHGAKMRAGVSAILRSDFTEVNGFDESFIGFGGEDDDLGRRLLAIGKVGYNFVRSFAPLHLYHESNYHKPDSTAISYTQQRKKEINRRNYRCPNGLDSKRVDIETWE